MTTIIIQLPDALQQRAQELALQRGGTIDELLQELLEEYLEEIEDMRETVEIKAHIASGEERTYPHEEVWYEEDTYPSLEAEQDFTKSISRRYFCNHGSSARRISVRNQYY